MELYTLWYKDTLVDENMTIDEFIQDLMDLEIDFSYTPDGNFFILNDKRYTYDLTYLDCLETDNFCNDF